MFHSCWSELLFLQQRKKSNQKNAAPISLPCGSPHHSPLPTGRPDSPSRLDMTKSDVPVGFSLPKPNGSANFVGRMFLPSSSPKTASLVGSIDHGRSIESCRAWTASQDDPLQPGCNEVKSGNVKVAEKSRITLRFIQADYGYAKHERPGCLFFWLLFFGHAKKSNSPSRRNKMINSGDKPSSRLKPL